MTAPKIVLGDLDFDTIKTNLKNFLRTQSEFSDYDFEGSGLNILLDILAYNTHYNAFYMNMIANEMFMDSASLRNTVVSHAKLLGYTPRSVTSSQAVVNVAITKSNTDPTTVLTLPRFAPFISEAINGTSYRFLNTSQQTVALTANSNTFNFSELVLKEGTPASYVFVADSSTNPSEIFVLPDANVDTSTLIVTVQASSTNTNQTIFTLATDATEVSATSNVYFLEENVDGKYQIYFGDDIIGASLSDGNLVAVSYIISNGTNANGLQKFTLQTPVLAGSTSNVTTLVKSSGASLQELVEDIKFSAPKAFVAQNRAVTKNDYVTLINKRYPYFDAVNVWGGEDEVPPIYGKVFISAKPKSGFSITEGEKEYVIDNVIKPISVLTVTPEFVDADYNFINVQTRVTYNPTLTNLSGLQIEDTIRNAVAVYAQGNLNQFNGSFSISKLLRAIDDSDPSIQSSSATIYIEKQFVPDLTTSRTYTLNYGTELHRGVSKDRLYSSPYFIQNDASGTTRQCYIEETPLSFSGLDSIQILNPGRNYTSTPSINIIGDGVGANAYPIIVNGKIQSVVVDSRGSEYTTATATVTGGGGNSASLVPIIQGQTGVLRTFYFDTNMNKIILDPNAGSIDYLNGVITITNFAPTDIGNDTKTLSVLIEPNTPDFSSDKTLIITFDPTNQGAVTITLIPVGS